MYSCCIIYSYNITFIIIINMLCDIISDIACVMYFLGEIMIVSGITCIMILGYIVCIMSVSITCFV